MCGFKARVEVQLEVDGKTIIDSRVAKLLYLIEKYGSLLAASKLLGIPYSRAWESIVKVERDLGRRVIEARRGGRGGGGAVLTEYGKLILEEYIRAYRRILGRNFNVYAGEYEIPSILYVGSHDPGVEILARLLRDSGVESIELSWVGSGLGLSAIALGEADVAGVHLYDPSNDTYNVSFIKKYWLEGKVCLVKGYYREIGFITTRKMSIDEIIDGLFDGRLRIINRQKGSGTRALLEYILEKEAIKRGLNYKSIVRRIKGFDIEAETHTEVARRIASGEADVGFGIKWAASQYNLEFNLVKLEEFDFVVPKTRFGKKEVKLFLEKLGSREFAEKLNNLPGYRIPGCIGEIIQC